MAIDTIFRLFDLGRMIALFIELGGKLKDSFGAELYAIAASLASILEDVNFSPGNLDFI
jgi:hypothetical protein